MEVSLQLMKWCCESVALAAFQSVGQSLSTAVQSSEHTRDGTSFKDISVPHGPM